MFAEFQGRDRVFRVAGPGSVVTVASDHEGYCDQVENDMAEMHERVSNPSCDGGTRTQKNRTHLVNSWISAAVLKVWWHVPSIADAI